MHDPFFMRRSECLGQRTGNLDDSLDGETARGDEAVERLCLDQFHREEVDAVRLLRRQDLERHVAAEFGVGGAIHLTPMPPAPIAAVIR